MTTHSQQEEVDRNYKAFKKMLSDLIKSDEGRFALLHNAELLACFDTNRDAQQAGMKLLGGKLYSVQKVTKEAIDLGHFSHTCIFR